MTAPLLFECPRRGDGSIFISRFVDGADRHDIGHFGSRYRHIPLGGPIAYKLASIFTVGKQSMIAMV